MSTTATQVVVIGGGQAGLAAGYYLRRAKLDFVVLDGQSSPGGSWQDYWPSLHLFSPSQYSHLPGWPMPTWPHGFPPSSHVRDYLTAYEKKYDLPVQRPVRDAQQGAVRNPEPKTVGGNRRRLHIQCHRP